MDDAPETEQNPDNNDEDEEDSTRCPFFSSSDQFHFMTVNEYERREDFNSRGDESEYSFGFVRPMDAVVGVLENPHGSVRLRQGSTTVLAAVYGPSDVRMSKELPHRAAVDILFRPKVTGSGNTSSMIAAGIMDPVMEERAIEQTITSVLESVIHLEDHLQAGFNVIIHEVEDHGCLLSTCINAAALALLNAGCSLRFLFASVTFCCCGESIVVDPSAEQVEALKKRSTTANPFSLITLVITNGTDRKSFSPDVLHMSSLGVVTPLVLAKVYKLATNTDLLAEVFGFFWRVISSDLVGVCGGTFGGGDDVKKTEEEGEIEDSSEDE